MEKYILTQAEISEVLEYLQGSCHSIEHALDVVTDGEINDLSQLANEDELHNEVERMMFLCVQCGWWAEAGDYAEVQPNDGNGDICTDCGPEEGEDA